MARYSDATFTTASVQCTKNGCIWIYFGAQDRHAQEAALSYHRTMLQCPRLAVPVPE